MKKLTHLTVPILFLLLLLASLALTLKPGAGIFYYKTGLQLEPCTPAEGYSILCATGLSARIFPPEEVLLFQDGKQLARETHDYVINAGDGTYFAESDRQGKVVLQFAPFGNGDLLAGESPFRVYYRVVFISRTTGIALLGLLLAGLLAWLGAALRPVKGARGFYPLRGIDRLLSRQARALEGMKATARGAWRAFFDRWLGLAAESTAAAFGLALLEWVFQVTGASFMSRMSLLEKLEVFLLSGLFLSLLALLAVLACLTLGVLLRLVKLGWLALALGELVPSALLAALVVLLVDNFTYTVFQKGILTASGTLRALYGVLAAGLLAGVYRHRLVRWRVLANAAAGPKVQAAGASRGLTLLALGVLAAAVGTAVLSYERGFRASEPASEGSAQALNYPHILLIGSDGVNAANMSVYSYERLTTPTLSALSGDLLVAENHFTNSGATLGSIVSIFTSKLPSQTGVIYPPNILQGSDAFEHLPGILSKAGYHTVQIGVPHYVDAFTMNVQDGFDLVNGQPPVQRDPLVLAWRNAGYESSAYFIYKLEEKLVNRLLHAFYLETVANPFDAVTQPASWLQDRQKMDELLSLLRQAEQPLFVHVHLMGTHGPRFIVQEDQFSQGQDQAEDWMPDFYDDAVLGFDGYVAELIEALKANGQYENTLLILYSDHAMRYLTNERLPLIFRFPGDAYAGKITANTQNIDIAPTVLDYLGFEIPAWMSGSSLLGGSPAADRLIFSEKVVNALQIENNLWTIDASQLQPPFYQFKSVQVIDCDRWYELDLRTKGWQGGRVAGHTAPCTEQVPPDEAALQQAIRLMLASQGYNVSSLEP